MKEYVIISQNWMSTNSEGQWMSNQNSFKIYLDNKSQDEILNEFNSRNDGCSYYIEKYNKE